METVKQLLPQVPRYFKANLHTHSTISDGKLTCEEIKKAYKALGYQILSLTDHNTTVDHSDMNDPDFLMLTGTEINVGTPKTNAVGGPTYHLNLIAKEPGNLWSPAKVYRKYPNAKEYEDKMQLHMRLRQILQGKAWSYNVIAQRAQDCFNIINCLEFEPCV